MIIKVVPLPSIADEVKFDIILPEGHVKTVSLDVYTLRAYRGASVTEIIEQIVLDLVQELGHNDPVHIVYL